MLPFRRFALQNVRTFHCASVRRFPIPESSSKAKSMDSQHTAGLGMNEPGAYKAGPTAADAKAFKDTGHGQHAKPDKYATWDSADSDSTVGIQALNKKAATAKRTATKDGATTLDAAKTSALNAAEKLKAAVEQKTKSVKAAVAEGAESVKANDVKTTINNVIHKAKETVSNMTSKVSDTASTVSHKLQDTKENLSERASSMGERMEHKFEDFAERVSASGQALDARDAAPDNDLDVPADAEPIGQQPNPERLNDVMEGVPGMTRQATQKTKGMTDDRHGGQM